MRKKFVLISLLLLVFLISPAAFSQNKNVKVNNSGIVKFAFLADLHISDVATNSEDLRLSVADLNSVPDLDFVIFGGDITEFGSDEEIARAHSIISELRMPWYIVGGNHDSKWSESGCNTFKEVFGYEFFDFEAGGVRFIGTNSGPNMRMAPALVPRDAVLWLDSLSKRIAPATPVVFVNHYPLDDAMLNYSDILTSLSRLNVEVALCGHGHNNRAYNYKVEAAGEPAASPAGLNLRAEISRAQYLPLTNIRGVMGRSNLRAGKGAHGYNIITLDKSSGNITFVERAGGVEKKPWHTLKMNTPLPEFAHKVLFDYQDNSDIGSAAVMDPATSGAAKGRIYWVNANGEVKAFDAAAGATGKAGSKGARSAAPAAAPAAAAATGASATGAAKPRWSFATGSKVFSTPAIHDNKIIFGATDTYIYCLDKESGKLIWKTRANKSVLGSPTIHNNIVYIGASDNIFRALDINTGKPVWEFNGVKSFVESKPFVDNEGVYFGSWGSTLYKLDPKSGSLLWSWTNHKGRGLSPAAVWPLVANGKVFIATPERMTHAIDAATGKELWRAKGGRESVGLSPDGNTLYIKTMQDTVFAYRTDAEFNGPVPNADKSVRLWSTHTGYGYEIAPSPTTAAYGYIFIPTDKGNIFILNEADGSLAGVIPFSGALINLVQPVGAGRLLVSSMDGRVALLEIQPAAAAETASASAGAAAPAKRKK
ncbi:MAG: PQQ-binding-like beta-propeller repeat protein [Bacteroidales bacterium]